MNTNISHLDVDGDGLGLRGSIEFTDRFHGFAGYSDLDLDFDVSTTQMEVGVGMNWSLSPNVDVVGTVSYLNLEVDLPAPFGSADDNAIALGGGLRGRVGGEVGREVRGDAVGQEATDRWPSRPGAGHDGTADDEGATEGSGSPQGPDDGTLNRCAVVASLPFDPDAALSALRHLERTWPGIRGGDGLLRTFGR